MHCPKCHGDMQPVEFRDVEVDRCEVCHGIWFDFAELEEMKDIVASEFVDDGDVTVGKEMNELGARCEACDRKMIKLKDRARYLIEYEVCPGCRGCFLDAGEFTSLKQALEGNSD